MARPNPSLLSLKGLFNDLTTDELNVLVDSDFRPTLKEAIALKLVESAQTFFTPLADEEIGFPELVSVAVKWRKLATNLGYSGPVAVRVRGGFTLKHHAPKLGPCCQNWGYLQDWKLVNDEPTKDAIVFWIPRLLPGSAGKIMSKQNSLLAKTREEYALPPHHLGNFGSAALLSGLILSLFKRTGERVPLERLWTRTDTLVTGGDRLGLGDFGEDGLDCDGWDWDGHAYDDLGCFPLGVEASGTPVA